MTQSKNTAVFVGSSQTREGLSSRALSVGTGNRVEKVIVNDYIEMRQEKVISVAKQLIQKPKQGLCQ
jgi:hypothetical protein